MHYELGGPFDPVSSEESLYRRSYPQKKFMNPDGSATSRAFSLRREKDEGKLSVDVVSMTTPEISVTQNGKFALGDFRLYEVSVVEVLGLDLQTYYDPILPENTAHAFIWGLEDDDETLPGLLARRSRPVTIG